MQARAIAVGAQLLGKRRGARVERLDREQRRAGAVEQVEPVAVAGAADRGHAAGADAGLLEAVADHRGGVAPEFLHVALDMAGRRASSEAPLRWLAASWRPVAVEQHRLDDGVAGVEAEQQAGLSHCW